WAVLDTVGHGEKQGGDGTGRVLRASRGGDVAWQDEDEIGAPRDEPLSLDGDLILGEYDAANVPHQRVALDQADALKRVDEGPGCPLGHGEGTEPGTEHADLHLAWRPLRLDRELSGETVER